MSDTDFPASVHILRPRRVSISSNLDGFLDSAGLVTSGRPLPRDDTRPSPGSINAVKCADCDQVEYLTREYCRCGHYLGGQLQDEYLAWEKRIYAQHSELSVQVERRLKPLRFLFIFAIPFLLVPMVHLAFWPDTFALSSFLWWAPAMLIAGAGTFAENQVIRPLKESAWFVENHTFETYVQQTYSGAAK